MIACRLALANLREHRPPTPLATPLPACLRQDHEQTCAGFGQRLRSARDQTAVPQFYFNGGVTHGQSVNEKRDTLKFSAPCFFSPIRSYPRHPRHPWSKTQYCQIFALDAALHYADIRAALEATGKSIGPLDLLIAAPARSLGATLVTANAGEFKRVKGLKVLAWK